MNYGIKGGWGRKQDKNSHRSCHILPFRVKPMYDFKYYPILLRARVCMYVSGVCMGTERDILN